MERDRRPPGLEPHGKGGLEWPRTLGLSQLQSGEEKNGDCEAEAAVSHDGSRVKGAPPYAEAVPQP